MISPEFGAAHAVRSILNVEGQGDVVSRAWLATVQFALSPGGARFFPSPVKRMQCFAYFFRNSLHSARCCESLGVPRPIRVFRLLAHNFSDV